MRQNGICWGSFAAEICQEESSSLVQVEESHGWSLVARDEFQE